VKPITIYFVEQSDQRYPTPGDSYESESGVWFKITRFDNPAHSLAILQYELQEFFRKKSGANRVPSRGEQEDDLK